MKKTLAVLVLWLMSTASFSQQKKVTRSNLQGKFYYDKALIFFARSYHDGPSMDSACTYFLEAANYDKRYRRIGRDSFLIRANRINLSTDPVYKRLMRFSRKLSAKKVEGIK